MSTDNKTTPEKNLKDFKKKMVDAIINSGIIQPLIHISNNRNGTTFSNISQEKHTDSPFTFETKPNMKEKMVINTAKGTATITNGKQSIIIPDFIVVANRKPSTYQLLYALTTALPEIHDENSVAFLSLEEYMVKMGIESEEEAWEQAKNDLETLFSAQILYGKKRKIGRTKVWGKGRIMSDKGIIQGTIHATFTSTFYNPILKYHVKSYQDQTAQLDKI